MHDSHAALRYQGSQLVTTGNLIALRLLSPEAMLVNMADVMTAEQRSRCMSKIRSAKTEPEMLLRRALWQAGLRFRVRWRLPGRPDIIFTRARLAVFVDGCFWHSCPVHGTVPKSNREYWDQKLAGNRARDERVTREILALGWDCMRFWEHEMKDDLAGVVRSIANRRAMRIGDAAKREAAHFPNHGEN